LADFRLAGGDLDGDDYTLIWDDRLLPHFQEEPADYTAPPTLKVNHVTLDNVKEVGYNIMAPLTRSSLSITSRTMWVELCRSF
jgi:hypothetical protein